VTPSPMVIDLHGYSMPIARAAVRSALYMLQKEAVSEGALLESSDRIEDIDSDIEDSSSSSSGSGSSSSRIVANTPATSTTTPTSASASTSATITVSASASVSTTASISASADSKAPSKGMGTLIFPDSPPKKDPAPVSSSNRVTPRGRRSLVIITGV
jgi:hypothetical protein